MRPFPLSAIKAGITRLRTKGGASPESLYDLVDGYVTAQRTMKIRPGTPLDELLPANSVGLCAFHGKLVFFATSALTPPSSKYQCAVLTHPTDQTLDLVDVHFSEPYVGALYVAAEFENGDVFHYWLEATRTWAANTVYLEGQLVQPTTENGLAYKATRIGSANPVWAPAVARTVGDKVEPTTYTGYYYEVTATTGTNVISGATEPTWPTNEGQTVIESADTAGITTTVPSTPGLPGGGVGGGTDDTPYFPGDRFGLDN